MPAVSNEKRENRTAERILDIAERLVQTRGFNNFSYADIATELRITTASLHYHFPSKAELGSALTARHAEQFAAALGQIDQHIAEPRAKLEAFTRLYEDVLRRERMYMCGILEAEYETLPKPMRSAREAAGCRRRGSGKARARRRASASASPARRSRTEHRSPPGRARGGLD